MVRLAILSDLHLEFDRTSEEPHGIAAIRSPASWQDKRALLKILSMVAPTPVHDDGHPIYGPDLSCLENAGVDLVLAAGDIDVRAWSIPWLTAVARYVGAPVAYVAGNHEFHGTIHERAIDFLRDQAARTNGLVTFLEKDILNLRFGQQDVVVFGCTLWTDYQLFGVHKAAMAEVACRSASTDHRRIGIDGGKRKWTPTDAKILHLDSREWLAGECGRWRAQRPDATLVMMTHHAPGPGSIHPHYENGLASAGYASDMRTMVSHADPDLYVHGHVHWPSDYRIGGIPVMANPRGYVSRRQEKDMVALWQPLTIDIHTRGIKPMP